MAASHQSFCPVPPALNTLPSEIRKMIVSYLAPDPDHLHLGCKTNLKNANLAHSCLREWVNEYMFRDMTLVHVVPGMCSFLELFAVTPENAGLLGFVKHIAVLVPAAIRWEVGINNPFALNLELITKERLCKKFGVDHPNRMSQEQQQYCASFHRGMVEPFTDKRRWHELLRTANTTWGQVFRYFTHVEEISVGHCESDNQPLQTLTRAFLLQHGTDVMQDVHPTFFHDVSANLAWASTTICRTAPPTATTLRLAMSNLDNFHSVSTVNRILTTSYRNVHPIKFPPHFTTLDLSICGVAGTHGRRDWQVDTGSAGSVRFWRDLLERMSTLQHLRLRNCLTTEKNARFSSFNHSDPKASVLDWLMPDLVLSPLRTLQICGFLLDRSKIGDIFGEKWTCLEKIVFDNVQLMVRSDDETTDISIHRDHLQGCSWLDVCTALTEKYSNLRIELNRPVSNVNDLENFCLSPRLIDRLKSIPKLVLRTEGTYGSLAD